MDEKMDAERAAFEAAYGATNEEQGLHFIPELNIYGSEFYVNHEAAERKSSAWYYWCARASLPVGVPAWWPTDEMVVRGAEELHDSLRQAGVYHDFDAGLNGTAMQQETAEAIFRAMLAASPAAPTVKAERVRFEKEFVNAAAVVDEDGFRLERAERPQAPSLPAAGSAGKYGSVLRPFMAMMEAELHANSGKGDRPGWLAMSAEQCMLEIYYHAAKLQKAVKKNDMQGVREYTADVANMSMMLADICGWLDIVSVEIATQQSAPERVSVPVELMRQGADLLDAHSSGPSIEQNIADDFRALLASHAEGGKV